MGSLLSAGLTCISSHLPLPITHFLVERKLLGNSVLVQGLMISSMELVCNQICKSSKPVILHRTAFLEFEVIIF